MVTHTKNNNMYETKEDLFGEFKVLGGDNNVGIDDPNLELNIIATPLDGGLELVKGQCKRIVFSYVFPKNMRRQVTHYAEVQDAAPGKFVTWCGFVIKKVYHSLYIYTSYTHT